MGLNIIVGVTAEDWDEYADATREYFAVIRRLLDRAGAGQWAEPMLDEQDVLEGDMWGYSGLHAVRRVAVHLAWTGALPEPLASARTAADDPLLKKAYTELPGEPAGPFDHLIYHSDCEGYYVPADFGQVIVDESLPGGYLGSSARRATPSRPGRRSPTAEPGQGAGPGSGRPGLMTAGTGQCSVPWCSAR